MPSIAAAMRREEAASARRWSTVPRGLDGEDAEHFEGQFGVVGAAFDQVGEIVAGGGGMT